jgi:hypothetical protein
MIYIQTRWYEVSTVGNVMKRRRSFPFILKIQTWIKKIKT